MLGLIGATSSLGEDNADGYGDTDGTMRKQSLPRSFLQDFGLNTFVAVPSANVGSKAISALGGERSSCGLRSSERPPGSYRP